MKRPLLLVVLLACLLVLPSSGSASGDVEVINGTSSYVCDEEVHLDLLKVTLVADDPQPTSEAVEIQAGCSGSTFERVEIDVYGDASGIRVENPALGAATDVTISGGYVAMRDAGLNTSQYGVTVMGGSDITFENLHVWGIDDEFTQAFRINKAGSGSGTPTNVICDGCFIGGGANSNTVVIGESDESGLTNSYACPDDTPTGGAITVTGSAVDPVNPGANQPGENFQPAATDPHCTATDVRNSSVESNSGFPAEWTTIVPGTMTAAWTSDSDAHFGANAAKATISSWSSGSTSLSSGSGYEVPVTENAGYNATAWVKGSGLSFEWRASWYVPGTGWVPAEETHSSDLTATYRQVALPLTSPTDATLLKLETSFGGDEGHGLIDDIDVTLREFGDTCLVSTRTQWPVGGATCEALTTITVTDETWACEDELSSYGPLPVRVVSKSTQSWNDNAITFDNDCEGDGNSDTVDVIVDVQAGGPTSGIGPQGDSAKFRETPGPHDIEVTGVFECGKPTELQTTLNGSHTLPQSTITVADTTGFANSGSIRIDGQWINYTGRTATTFTGASGGTGSYTTGEPVTRYVAHPDTWQFQGGDDLTIVNGRSGDYTAGTATCGGAGGSTFWSTTADVTILGGEYVACNHGLNGNGDKLAAGNVVTDTKFRTGRVDGTDPNCVGFFPSNPCINTLDMTLTDLTCQRWDVNDDIWENVAATN